MKSIHIITHDAHEKHKLHIGDFHGMDIPNGHIVIHDAEDAARENLEAEPGTIALPYLLDGSPIGEAAAAALSHIGVLASDNAFQTSVKLSKHHGGFHPSRI
jgi:hypothetical protein